MSISNYIRDDLANRLRSGQDLPAQLTIGSLAELYEVSFTPVRTAIAELIHDGLLEKGPNRRLVVTSPLPAEDVQAGPVAAPAPPRDPYQEIVSDLVQLSLKGKTIYLREEMTAERYDISRSVIRNIFHRLTGEGILDHIPRRGWRLRAFRQDDLQSYIEVRESLELKALSLAFPKIDKQEVKRMLEANVFPSSATQSPKIDESLHAYLIKLSGNSYIQDFFSRQGRYYELLFSWEDHDRETAIETVRQHRAILAALLESNEHAARSALSYHILNNHPILNQIAEKSLALNEE